jgi:hypothetical protein
LRAFAPIGKRIWLSILVSGLVHGGKGWCDKEAGTMAGRQQALGDQAFARFIDAGLAEQVLPRQLADGWQSSPRLHRILSDPARQPVDNLLHDGHQGLSVDSQFHE